jgi:Flp pilus assembly protein TadG
MWNRFKTMLKAETGNTAVIFALSIVPLMLAAGASVDMVRANRAQAMLQAAVDAAVLSVAANPAAIARPNNGSAVNSAALAQVNDYLLANKSAQAVDQMLSVDTEIDRKKGTLTIIAKGKMKTSLMQLAGIIDMDIDVMSEVRLGARALEVALVLDNTGSMAGQKILDLKSSAKSMVATLFAQKASYSLLKFGVVPFSEYVNVGSAANTTSWLDPNIDPPGAPWEGCVGSRPSPLDKGISSTSGSMYVPVGNVHCVASILNLTDIKADIDSKIDSMAAEGNTYIPAGLLWGWHMLAENSVLGGSLSKAELKDLGGKKALVLMTDGENTISATGIRHDGSDRGQADALTAQLCANAKADDITVFTIAFQVPSQGIKDILEACATTPGMAFDAANSVALNEAFTSIGQQLASLHLSK